MSTPRHARVEIEKPDILPLPSAMEYKYASFDSKKSWSGAGIFVFAWTPRDGFLVQVETSMRTKTLAKFPLTEAGWDEAWTLMASEYPDLAQAVAERALRSQHSHRAAKRSQEAKQELESLQSFATVDCVLLGGYGYGYGYGYESSFAPGTPCVLHFTDEGLWVRTTRNWVPQIRTSYADAKALEFSGPGEVKKGGGFFGGGFGVVGAVEGMAIAALLNSLTARSEIQTVIRFEGSELEAFFFHSKTTPDKLRIALSQAVGRINRDTAVPVTATADPVADLERLARLHDQGVLSDEEFTVLKVKLIARISGD